MCGRLALDNDYLYFANQFGILDAAPPADVIGGSNVCPTQRLIAVAIGKDGTRKLIYPHWGMIDDRGTQIPRTINARAENVARTPLWRPLFEGNLARGRAPRRCLIAFDSFYEWKSEPAPEPEAGRKAPKPKKTAYTIKVRGNRAVAFAGLYSLWPGVRDNVMNPEVVKRDKPDLCATIITTVPNNTIAPLHDRMPVILDEDEFPAWLGETPASIDELLSLLKPYRDGPMEVAPGGPFG